MIYSEDVGPFIKGTIKGHKKEIFKLVKKYNLKAPEDKKTSPKTFRLTSK